MNTLLTLIFVAAIILFCTTYNSFTFSETLRYLFDMGYNIGMGDGNINEKDDISLFVTSIWMIIGNVIFFQWCLALVRASLGMPSTGLMHGVAHKSRSVLVWISNAFHLSPQVFVVILIVLWTTFGICIGVIVEEWTFVKSLNFAIGGMTTTGSQIPSNQPLSNVLTGIFLAVGVPLFSIVSSVVILPDFITNTETLITKGKTLESEESETLVQEKFINKNTIHF